MIEIERDQAFSLAIDDGLGEFHARLGFGSIGVADTKVSVVIGAPRLDESADADYLVDVAELWLHKSERLLEISG